MTRRPRKLAEQRTTFRIGTIDVPVRIITEAGRNGARASVTKQALFIRLPHGTSAAERERLIADFRRWAEDIHRTQPATFERFRPAEVAREFDFSLRGATYRIGVVDHDLRQHRINRIGERELKIELSRRAAPGTDRGRVVEKLLAKWFGKQELPRVSERVHELNERHFRRPVNAVKLSDTYSRWGSCSHTGNINLSTRLILAPDPVLDAVIIHELAHLVEQNHSRRFWKLVEDALPEYKAYDRWLREHGSKLGFQPV